MQAAAFAPVDHAGVEQYASGEQAAAWSPGDFILTHGDARLSKLIRFGERLRIHGDDRKYAWFNHAALVLNEHGDLAEALANGVVRTSATKYLPKHYAVVRVGASVEDTAEVLSFAEWVLETRHSYGWFTITSIAITMLTGAKFTFFVDGTFICSGFVARAMERTGAIFSRDPVHITPADLAKYYGAQPPLGP
jgi:hypothetical protein